MGKKSGRNGDGAAKPTAFVLKFAMHCRCNGCDDKIRAAVKDLTLQHGIEALDQSALWTKGELTVVSTADPEKLRRRLHKDTRKKVDLLFPKPQQQPKPAAADKDATTAALEDLLRRTMLQQGQYGGQAAWANQVLPGWTTLQQQGGFGYGVAAPQAYQWPQPQPEVYPTYHAAYPAGAAGAYAYPSAPPQAYGGGWHGHGAY